MGQQRSFTAKLKKAQDRLRENGLKWVLLHYMQRFGVQATTFYYTKEVLPPVIPIHLITLPEGFEFSIFGLDEVMAISRLPEREDYIYEGYVVDNFKKGDTCLGIKYRGEIAAFTWSTFDKDRCRLYPAVLAGNEAYLFDMYVLKAFRGKNLAPFLRYKNYEVLKGMGRDTFYSITDTSNTASFRFKQKLNARVVFFGLYVNLFNKCQNRWILKKY